MIFKNITTYTNPMDFFCKPLLVILVLISTIEAHPNVGITVDLIHRDSALSPSYAASLTPFERLKKSIDRSFSRKKSLGLKSNVISPDSFDSTVASNGGEYLMKIHLGTPPVEILAIADTGSDLTWTQCSPCNTCYEQRAPLFDPRRTRSYRPISCRSPQCATAEGSCDSNSKCGYEMNYGDQSYSFGDVASENLTFKTPNSLRTASFPGFLFGCGYDNAGTFDANTSGIIGLGGGKISMIRQLSKSIAGRFSYCLIPFDSPGSSKISFGTNAVITGPNVVSTPIVRKYPDTFYYLTLEGISVGRKRIAYQPKSRGAKADDEGNIIIDSGTTLTFLPQYMYKNLELALTRVIRAERTTNDQFGLCYKVGKGGRGFSAPPIVLHFKGADLVFPATSTFLLVNEGVICLTFVPSVDISIFGNLHQMNFHIGYDLVKGVVNFQPTDCSKST